MVNRTALKVGALAGVAVLGFFLLRWVVGMLVRLVQIGAVAVLAAVLAYVAYRVWSVLGNRGTDEDGVDPEVRTGYEGARTADAKDVDSVDATDDFDGANATDDFDGANATDDFDGADALADLGSGTEADELTDEEFRKELEELEDS